jgi:hypothetical protein
MLQLIPSFSSSRVYVKSRFHNSRSEWKYKGRKFMRKKYRSRNIDND